MLVNTSDQEFRHTYAKLMEKRNKALKKDFDKLRIDMVSIKSDEPFFIPLKKFFAIRARRMIR